MTPVGHTLFGLAVGTVCLPRRLTLSRKLGHYFAFALLANIPDLRLPNWGHNRYDISHSLFVNSLLIIIAIFVSARWTNIRYQLEGSIAWLSHLLLDSFYNHGLGVAIFWPFSKIRLVLPLPWFSVVKSPPPFTYEVIQEFLVEFVCYSPLLLIAIAVRKLKTRNK